MGNSSEKPLSPNAWKKEEDEFLARAIKAGLSDQEIAAALNKPLSAVVAGRMLRLWIWDNPANKKPKQ